jgi:hypothetical protein
MLHSDYREKAEIRWMWTKNGKIVSEQSNFEYGQNQISDWFRAGQVAIDKAEGAAMAEEADRILTEAYLGDDRHGVGLHWEITFYTPGRLS